MKKLSNKAYAFVILIILIISTALILYSVNNYKKYSETSKKYKNLNTVLTEKISESEENINQYNSKSKAIDESLTKMQEKSKKYDSLKLNKSKDELEKFRMKSIEGNYDRDRKDSIKNVENRYRKLRSAFYSDDEVGSLDEAKSNILISSALVNNYVYTKLNTDIAKNNSEIDKKTGPFTGYDNSNYLVKSIIADYINNNDINSAAVKNKTYENLFLLNSVINAYDAVLFPSDKNYSYILSLRDEYNNKTKETGYTKSVKMDNAIKENIRSIDNSVLFEFDTFSQNIDYMHNYDILDKTFETDNGVKVLRYLVDKRGRLYCAEERLNGEPKSMSYFNSSGNPFVLVDMENYKIYYFNESKNDKEYNRALQIYNDYKRN